VRPLVPLTYPLCAVAAFLLGSAGIAWLAPELSGHYITHGCNAVPPPRPTPRRCRPPFSMTGVIPGPRDTPHPDDMDRQSAGDDGGTANAPLGSN